MRPSQTMARTADIEARQIEPAVANALVDALSVLGVTHVAMPATPEVLWRTINGARGKNA